MELDELTLAVRNVLTYIVEHGHLSEATLGSLQA